MERPSVEHLIRLYGPGKSMGESASRTDRPHYFLLRRFLRDLDLLMIFNTRRCRYQCAFCQLPAKCSRDWIPDGDLLAQFEFVVAECKHALSVVERVTISNEGSVLDESTFGDVALGKMISSLSALPALRRVELETRLEFVTESQLCQLSSLCPRAQIGILTGFETQDEAIRDEVLVKREPLSVFTSGLDRVATVGAALTAYVLFKPDPGMTDDEAYSEADRSIEFLAEQCGSRSIPLTVRLNPMYLASGSRWAERARSSERYQPPRLTDVMRLAEKHALCGRAMYIGLSTEGLAEPGGSYRAREDYSHALIRPIMEFNSGERATFDWSTSPDQRRGVG